MTASGPHPGRVSRLRSTLGRKGPSALLVTHLPNVRWLSGFTGSSGTVLITARDAVFFTDFRYRGQARREVRGARRVEYPSGAIETLAGAVKRARISRLGVEAEHMTVSFHADLAAALPGVELVPMRGTVERLRAVKDRGEVAAIRRAISIAETALASTVRRLAGRSEAAVRDQLEAAVRNEGAEDVSFPTIVASGPRSAMPHARACEKPIGRGKLVVIDFGARLGGYCSDITRTFCPGGWGEKAKSIYKIVLQAQSAALDAIRPGVDASAIDAAARTVIEAAGFGRNFGHGTGHGVGLEIHELPQISQRSGEVVTPGMVFTVEPGVYLEDFGGVRIEDMVLVTTSGREILSRRIPKLLGS